MNESSLKSVKYAVNMIDIEEKSIKLPVYQVNLSIYHYLERMHFSMYLVHSECI